MVSFSQLPAVKKDTNFGAARKNFSTSYFVMALEVSKFQNEFMKSSFLPKYEPNIVRISALYHSERYPPTK